MTLHPISFRNCLIALLFVLAANNTFGQLEKSQVVEISLGQDKFIESLFPFDQPFYMKGKVPDNCTKIIFSYSIDSKLKNKGWVGLPPKDSISVWEKKSPSEETFILFCPGIHPNAKYNFNFKVITKITTDKANELKPELINTYIHYLYAMDSYTGTTQINAELNNTLKTALNSLPTASLVSAADPKTIYSADISKADWAAEFNSFWKALNDIKTDSLQLATVEGVAAINSFTGTAVNSLLTDANFVLKESAKLTEQSKEFLNAPVNIFLPKFKDYTLNEGIKVLKNLCMTADAIKSLLHGKSKIVSGKLVPTDSIDYESIYFVNYLLKRLSEGIIAKSVTTTSAQTLFIALTASITTPADHITSRFAAAAVKVEKLEANRKKLQYYMKAFPDFTTKFVMATGNKVEAISIPDITSEKTPYISGEAGIGWSQSFNKVFNYIGTNIYLAAVNKKAHYWKKPLRGGGYAFIKSFCFNVGVASYFGDRPTNTRSIFGEGSKQDLMLGVGFRIGRIAKINFSTLPYTTNNDAPHSDTFKPKCEFLISAGIDVDLLKAFGDVGKKIISILN